MREVVLLGGSAHGRRLNLPHDERCYSVPVFLGSPVSVFGAMSEYPPRSTASYEIENYLVSTHHPAFMVIKGWRLGWVRSEHVVCSSNILGAVTAFLEEGHWVQERGFMNQITGLHESLWLVPGPVVEA